MIAKKFHPYKEKKNTGLILYILCMYIMSARALHCVKSCGFKTNSQRRNVSNGSHLDMDAENYVGQSSLCRYKSYGIIVLIGHFHYGVILLQLPESFRFLFCLANYSYCSLLSPGITKFEFVKENEMNSGSCSKMTPS